jgi:hypothetical protein
MDFFLILQILFDAVLLFSILFLFHFSVNQQQKKSEEFDIVKNIQVQEMRENLEKLLSAMKQLGNDVSEDIQNKINESEKKTEIFKRSLDKLESQLNGALELAEEVNTERGRPVNKIKFIRTIASQKEKLPSNGKIADKSISRVEKKKKALMPKTGYSIGFSSGIVKQVYKMIDENMDISEVAKATRLTRAEINLILNLRENRFTASN